MQTKRITACFQHPLTLCSVPRLMVAVQILKMARVVLLRAVHLHQARPRLTMMSTSWAHLEQTEPQVCSTSGPSRDRMMSVFQHGGGELEHPKETHANTTVWALWVSENIDTY